MNDDRCSPTGKRASMHNQAAPMAPTSDDTDLVITVSEDDVRIVDAYYYELALDASKDPSPPTPEEQIELAKLAASFERLKAMTHEEMLEERERRLRRRRLEGE
jgi:predicted P-loop ATPase/GTPase